VTGPGHTGTEEFADAFFRRSRIVRFGATATLLAWVAVSMMRIRPFNGYLATYTGATVALLLVVLVGFARARRIGITVDDDGVTARTTYSTRQWRWDQLKGAHVLEREIAQRQAYLGRIHLTGERVRMLLVLDLRNGLDVRLYGLKVVTSSYLDRHWLHDAMREINARVQLRRRPTPS
jgi:hypothetical protein